MAWGGEGDPDPGVRLTDLAPAGGVAAWDDFQAAHSPGSYPIPDVPVSGEGGEKQLELEKRYSKP